MSCWTYVSGIIEVGAIGETQPEMRYILETVLSHLPKVTGSEEDMYVHLVQMGGYNGSCSHNELDEPMWHINPRTKIMRTQSNYMIVLEGHFRDRVFSQTFKEMNKFLNRLAKRLDVTDILVRVSGQSKEYVFDDPKPYFAMFEHPSWASDKGFREPAWWEYLVYSRDPDTRYPIALERKYYENPENDAEWLRRQEYEWGKR